MITIIDCPFCGKDGTIEKIPLWNGSHGYPDCYDIFIRCSNTMCPIRPKTRSYDTISEKNEHELIKKAVADWNTRSQE